MASDPIPRGYVSLSEAFDIFRALKRGPESKPPDYGTPERRPWEKLIAAQLDEDDDQLSAPFVAGELEAIVRLPDGVEYRIRATDFASARWPTRMFLSDTIADFSDGPLWKFRDRTPYLPRASLDKWLDRNIRDWLLGEIAYGRLEPPEAERRLKTAGLRALLTEPDPDAFDPFVETYWSMPMTVAWIAWRHSHAVTRQWDPYRKIGGWWKETRVAGREKSGFIIEPSSGASLRSLSTFEGVENLAFKSEVLMTISEARNLLWRELERGELVATGIPESGGNRRAILAHEWQDLVPEEVGRSEVLRRRQSVSKTGYLSVTMGAERITMIWPVRPQMDGAAINQAENETASVPIIDKAQIDSLYCERVKNWSAGKPPPSFKHDRLFLQQANPKITRDKARDVRKRLAPADWKRPGIRKSGE